MCIVQYHNCYPESYSEILIATLKSWDIVVNAVTKSQFLRVDEHEKNILVISVALFTAKVLLDDLLYAVILLMVLNW